MQEYSVKVTSPDGQVMAVTASESDTLEAVADRFKDYYEDDIILGIVNGRLRELNKKIKSDCELSFVTTADRDGRRTYRRSVVLLLQRAIYDVYGSMTQLHVMHSLGEGYYCQLEKAVECADSQQEKHSSDNQGSSENSVQSVTGHDIDRIVCSMYSFVEKDLPITKHSAKTQYAEQLFKEKGLCAECHILDPDERAGKVLFTDHTYDNLGIPSNPGNPFFKVSAPYNTCGKDTMDLGLGSRLRDPEEYGKFRVPTLRNIALTAPYGHNGYFKTLEEIVHFYNVRDVEDFPPAEYPETVNKDELGNLGLSQEEETAIVAFLRTLTDCIK